MGTGLSLAALAIVLPTMLGSGCVIEDRDFEVARPDCDEYCSTVENRCSGDRQIYAEGECLAVCKALSPGNVGDTTGNSIACRQQLFATNLETNACANAGPLGGDRCGSDCEGYCAIRRALCSGTEDNCEASCAALQSRVSYTSDARLDNQDTLQCRVRHAIKAAVAPEGSPRGQECSFAAVAPPDPNSFPCLDPVDLDPDAVAADRDLYCGLVMAACQGELAVYEDLEQCKATAELLEVGAATDSVEDTLRCRRYHAYNALLNGQQHCTHAGPTGDGHCSAGTPPVPDEGNCNAYCFILSKACEVEFEQFGANALAACADSCTAIPGALGPDMFGAQGSLRYSTAPQANLVGDNLQCRTFHAVRALGANPNDDRSAECRAAFALPGTECAASQPQ